jgi:molybdopterin-containing oxidoreductase family iron-sulfur binding subunit
MKVCPTGATFKDDKGRVEIDYDKCIGCRMCMAACPYNVRVFNWNEPVRDPDFNYGDKDVPVRPKGVMEKCTLCKERTDRGEEPMCVVCCPFDARVYGDLDDPDSEISKLRSKQNVRILLEDMGTKPQVFYLQ